MKYITAIKNNHYIFIKFNTFYITYKYYFLSETEESKMWGMKLMIQAPLIFFLKKISKNFKNIYQIFLISVDILIHNKKN